MAKATAVKAGMATVIAHLESASPYSQSRHYDTDEVPKGDKESNADYERRTWMNRLHVDENDMVFIPAMSFKNCLSEAAKYLSRPIKGKGKATYTKHFEAGVLVPENAPLGIKKSDVKSEWLFVPSDGVRGSGKRVNKCFPLIREWKAKVQFLIFDLTVTEEEFAYHLEQAGRFIGIGRFRPRNNGFYGRFSVNKIEWSETT